MDSAPVPMRRRRMFLRLMLGVLLALVVLAAGLVFFWQKLPYQSAAARQIVALLAGYGVEVTSLAVHELGPNRAVMSDVALGRGPGLNVASLEATYSFAGLRRGEMPSLLAKGVKILAYEENGVWKVSGLESALAPKAEKTPPPSGAELRALLPERVSLSESAFHLRGKDWEIQSPFEMTATADGAFAFNAPRLTATGLPAALPPLALNIKGTLGDRAVTAAIRAQDAPADTAADLDVTLPLADPAKGSARIKRLRFPWGGGRISAGDFTVKLAMNAPIALTVRFEEVQLAALLNDATGGKVQGTGRVSGSLPLIYHPDGVIELQEGAGQGLEAGSITVAPELIPGEGRPELETLRLALQDFRYTSLKIRVSSDAQRKSAIHLALEGSNPNAFEGRAVKLNVNLTGDILPLLQQSLMPIQDVRKLLRTKE